MHMTQSSGWLNCTCLLLIMDGNLTGWLKCIFKKFMVRVAHFKNYADKVHITYTSGE